MAMNRHERRAYNKLVVNQTSHMLAGRRECGECDACCYALGVPSLKKQMNERCSFANGNGCDCYNDRPAECKTFNCLWLVGFPGLDEDDRPDKTGVVLDTNAYKGDAPVPVLLAYGARPGAIESPEAHKFLITLVHELGHAVVVIPDMEHRRLMAPPGHMAVRLLTELKARPT